MDTWIGAGGWAYFTGTSGRRLADYARAFRFVEVNATFYRHPPIPYARRWRRSVPTDFHFAVKGHRVITHMERFRATPRAMSAISRDAAILKALDAEVLVLETPVDLPFGREEVAALKDFSAALARGQRIALEPRAHAGRPLPPALASALRDAGGIDVVDLSKGDLPRVESDVQYTRLFGKGPHNVWEFSDEELREIDRASRSGSSNRMVFTFHGVRMYKDAARFTEFRSSGRLPPATRERGQRALEEVLAPDARFPTTREDLLRDHGWKVVASEGGTNVHASDLLAHLPNRRYATLQGVLASLKTRPGSA